MPEAQGRLLCCFPKLTPGSHQRSERERPAHGAPRDVRPVHCVRIRPYLSLPNHNPQQLSCHQRLWEQEDLPVPGRQATHLHQDLQCKAPPTPPRISSSEAWVGYSWGSLTATRGPLGGTYNFLFCYWLSQKGHLEHRVWLPHSVESLPKTSE